MKAVPCVGDCPRRLNRATDGGRAHTHSEHCEDERDVVLVAFAPVVVARVRDARLAAAAGSGSSNNHQHYHLTDRTLRV